MAKFHLECFFDISTFPYHRDVRSELLNYINNSDYKQIIHNSAEVNISRCDWHKAKDFQKLWFRYIQENLFNAMLKIYRDLGYDGFTLHEIWFQQYEHESMHGWHTHSCNFTNVYYLELPDEGSKTQLINPFDQKTVIELDVKEGDIVVFPSFVIHKGPKNLSQKRKTIISYNTNVTYSDNIYANHLGK